MHINETQRSFDLLIIGGGINGCGIARDASGRGYSVLLAEMNDLASGTSSWSTKLIHGGLRYLEYYEFRLVREALREREILWQMAPHIVQPLRFVLPHHKGLRPAWLIRLGLFLYDHIGGRKHLAATKVLDLAKNRAGKPLKPLFKKGFEYSDCRVDDARLVVLNARDAANRGADIRIHTKVIRAKRHEGQWQATLYNKDTGQEEQIKARLIVNAAGPWVDQVLSEIDGAKKQHHIRLVQGSHIIVNRLYDHERGYIFQNSDKRVIFAIPYESDYTLIGTTDRDYEGDPAAVKITQEEINYLCAAASEYFNKPVTRADIVWSYSGVRPLFDDGASKAQAATRDYTLKIEKPAPDEAALINIFGGKITTFRQLAETIMQEIEQIIGTRTAAWTGGATLPGGDFPINGLNDLVTRLQSAYPFLDKTLTRRLCHAYGTQAFALLDGVTSNADMGEDFSAGARLGLSAREVDYLIAEEWARSADDILWRRSKLGLKISDAAVNRLDDYIKKGLPDD